jgi:UMF1 family MFS transporter
MQVFNFISFNLTMVMMPEWYGISDGSLPARISFLSVSGGWFCTNYFYYFPINFSQKTGKDYILKDLESLR